MEKEIKTNYRKERYEYPICNGEDRKGWTIKLKDSCRESDHEFFERLVEQGYKRISFYETTTCVKGLHELIAYVK